MNKRGRSSKSAKPALEFTDNRGGPKQQKSEEEGVDSEDEVVVMEDSGEESTSLRHARLTQRQKAQSDEQKLDELLKVSGVEYVGMSLDEKKQLAAILSLSVQEAVQEKNVRQLHEDQQSFIDSSKKNSSESYGSGDPGPISAAGPEKEGGEREQDGDEEERMGKSQGVEEPSESMQEAQSANKKSHKQNILGAILPSIRKYFTSTESSKKSATRSKNGKSTLVPHNAKPQPCPGRLSSVIDTDGDVCETVKNDKNAKDDNSKDWVNNRAKVDDRKKKVKPGSVEDSTASLVHGSKPHLQRKRDTNQKIDNPVEDCDSDGSVKFLKRVKRESKSATNKVKVMGMDMPLGKGSCSKDANFEAMHNDVDDDTPPLPGSQDMFKTQSPSNTTKKTSSVNEEREDEDDDETQPPGEEEEEEEEMETQDSVSMLSPSPTHEVAKKRKHDNDEEVSGKQRREDGKDGLLSNKLDSPVFNKKNSSQNEEEPTSRKNYTFSPFPYSPVKMLVCKRRQRRKYFEKRPLYYAPVKVDPVTYTAEILGYFEQYRVLLRGAQAQVMSRVPWGEPVQPGQHFPNTLDVKRKGERMPTFDLEFDNGLEEEAPQEAKQDNVILRDDDIDDFVVQDNQTLRRSRRNAGGGKVRTTPTLFEDDDDDFQEFRSSRRKKYVKKVIVEEDELPDLSPTQNYLGEVGRGSAECLEVECLPDNTSNTNGKDVESSSVNATTTAESNTIHEQYDNILSKNKNLISKRDVSPFESDKSLNPSDISGNFGSSGMSGTPGGLNGEGAPIDLDDGARIAESPKFLKVKSSRVQAQPENQAQDSSDSDIVSSSARRERARKKRKLFDTEAVVMNTINEENSQESNYDDFFEDTKIQKKKKVKESSKTSLLDKNAQVHVGDEGILTQISQSVKIKPKLKAKQLVKEDDKSADKTVKRQAHLRLKRTVAKGNAKSLSRPTSPVAEEEKGLLERTSIRLSQTSRQSAAGDGANLVNQEGTAVSADAGLPLKSVATEMVTVVKEIGGGHVEETSSIKGMPSVSGVDCPICGESFSVGSIEEHAAGCYGGDTPSAGQQAASLHTRSTNPIDGDEIFGQSQDDAPPHPRPPIHQYGRARHVIRNESFDKVFDQEAAVSSEDEWQPSREDRQEEKLDAKEEEIEEAGEKEVQARKTGRKVEDQKRGIVRPLPEETPLLQTTATTTTATTLAEAKERCLLCQRLIPLSRLEHHMNRCLDEQEGGQGDAQTNPEPRSTRNRVKGHGSADLGAGSGTGLLMANTGSTASTDSDNTVEENLPLNPKKRKNYFKEKVQREIKQNSSGARLDLPENLIQISSQSESDESESESSDTSEEYEADPRQVRTAGHTFNPETGTQEIDWDAISSSPIRSFQAISALGDNTIDYQNQFRRRARGGAKRKRAAGTGAQGKRKRKKRRKTKRKAAKKGGSSAAASEAKGAANLLQGKGAGKASQKNLTSYFGAKTVHYS